MAFTLSSNARLVLSTLWIPPSSSTHGASPRRWCARKVSRVMRSALHLGSAGCGKSIDLLMERKVKKEHLLIRSISEECMGFFNSLNEGARGRVKIVHPVSLYP